MENNGVISKKTLAEFVDDAIDMEVKIYSLRDLADKLRKKGREISSRASSKITQMEKRVRDNQGMSTQELAIRNEIKANEDKIKELEKTLDDEIKYYGSMQGNGSIIVSAIVTLLVVAVICSVIMTLVLFPLSELDGLAEFLESMLMAATMLIIVVAEVIVIKSGLSKKKKKVLKQAKEHVAKRTEPLEKRIVELKKQLENPSLAKSRIGNEELAIIRNNCAIDRQNAQKLFDEAMECDSKAMEIENILKQCYAQSNIVPPDYRYVDCLLVLQHAFRNGLADNMKEAVLYYEQKEFRNEVIRGVNNIHDMLGQLANTMMEVRGVLNSIDGNVNAIMRNQEISNNIQSARMYAEKEFHEAQLAHNKWVERTFASFE